MAVIKRHSKNTLADCWHSNHLQASQLKIDKIWAITQTHEAGWQSRGGRFWHCNLKMQLTHLYYDSAGFVLPFLPSLSHDPITWSWNYLETFAIRFASCSLAKSTSLWNKFFPKHNPFLTWSGREDGQWVGRLVDLLNFVLHSQAGSADWSSSSCEISQKN